MSLMLTALNGPTHQENGETVAWPPNRRAKRDEVRESHCSAFSARTYRPENPQEAFQNDQIDREAFQNKTRTPAENR